MKRADVARADVLVNALRDIRQLTQACNLRKPDDGYDRLGLEVSVGSICSDGSTAHAHLELDLVTAKLLMPMIKRLIVDELNKIGVKS